MLFHLAIKREDNTAASLADIMELSFPKKERWDLSLVTKSEICSPNVYSGASIRLKVSL